MKRRIISISIAEDVLSELDNASRMSNMSKSRLIENLLIEALYKGDPDGDEEIEL